MHQSLSRFKKKKSTFFFFVSLQNCPARFASRSKVIFVCTRVILIDFNHTKARSFSTFSYVHAIVIYIAARGEFFFFLSATTHSHLLYELMG